MKFEFWQRWLTYANVLTVGVGLLVAFAGNSFFFATHNAATERLFFGEASFTPDVLRLKAWLFGIIGGTIVGFHVLMIMISEYAFRRRERWAYRAMWAGLLSWFLIDSGVSLYYGAIHNIVLINLVALLLIGLPLVMTRRAFRSVPVLLAGWLLTGCTTPPPPAPVAATTVARPNILLFIADDWSYPHAGAYGDPVVATPNFDRLAREGMLFTNAYCASPSCSPSRASILTGRYPHQNGAMGNLWSEFSATATVYPHELERAGYRVGHDQKGWGPGDWWTGGWPHNPAGQTYPSFAKFLAATPSDRPFCYWFGSSDPHREYRTNLGAWTGLNPDSVRMPPFLPDLACVRNDMLDYYAEVERFDRHVGEVLDLLASRGELDNTLIVVTSDNGMPFPRAKANLYDYGVRVPLVIRWPGHVAAGTVRRSFVNLAALAATFVAAAGATVPDEMQLPSLLPELADAGVTGRGAVLLERERHAQVRADSGSYAMRALRTDSFLYVRNFFPERWPAGDPRAVRSVGAYGDVDNSITKMLILDGRRPPGDTTDYFRLAFGKRPAAELYDLRHDSGQTKNVAADPTYAAVVAEYDRRLTDRMAATGDPRFREPRTTRWDTVRYTPIYGTRSYDLEAYLGDYRYARRKGPTSFTLAPCGD